MWGCGEFSLVGHSSRPTIVGDYTSNGVKRINKTTIATIPISIISIVSVLFSLLFIFLYYLLFEFVFVLIVSVGCVWCLLKRLFDLLLIRIVVKSAIVLTTKSVPAGIPSIVPIPIVAMDTIVILFDKVCCLPHSRKVLSIWFIRKLSDLVWDCDCIDTPSIRISVIINLFITYFLI